MVCSRRLCITPWTCIAPGAAPGKGQDLAQDPAKHSVSRARRSGGKKPSTGICAAGRGKTLAARSAALPRRSAKCGGSRNLGLPWPRGRFGQLRFRRGARPRRGEFDTRLLPAAAGPRWLRCFAAKNDAPAKNTATRSRALVVPVAEMGALTAAASQSFQLGLRRKKLYVSDPSPSGSRRAPCFPLPSALEFSRLPP